MRTDQTDFTEMPIYLSKLGIFIHNQEAPLEDKAAPPKTTKHRRTFQNSEICGVGPTAVPAPRSRGWRGRRVYGIGAAYLEGDRGVYRWRPNKTKVLCELRLARLAGREKPTSVLDRSMHNNMSG